VAADVARVACAYAYKLCLNSTTAEAPPLKVVGTECYLATKGVCVAEGRRAAEVSTDTVATGAAVMVRNSRSTAQHSAAQGDSDV
jgi:hypothetical protein